MNYKTIEYRNIDDKGICSFLGSYTNSLDGSICNININTYASFQTLLEPIKNCVLNRVYLRVKPDIYSNSDYANTILYVKKTESEDSEVGPTVSQAYYNQSQGQYILDITKAFESDTFTLKYLKLYSQQECYFFNLSASDYDRLTLVVEYVEYSAALISEKNIGLTLSDGLFGGAGVSFGVQTIQKPLVSYGGEGLPHNLSLNYCGTNYDQVNFTGMPKGWILNYQQKVEYDSETNSYLFTDGSGIKRKFVQAIGSTTTFYDVSGSGLILVCNSDNSYKIIDGYKSELIFNSSGLLTQISKKCDATVLSIVIHYDSIDRVDYVDDGMGRRIALSYHSDYIEITGAGMTTTKLKFNSGGYLTQIYEVEVCKNTITYNSDNRISTISDANNEKLTFTYDNDERVIGIKQDVVKIEETLVEEFTFYYKMKSTIVKNRMHNYTKYIFDDERNIVSVIQDDTNIKTLMKNELAKVLSTIQKESYRSYIGGNIMAPSEGTFTNVHATNHNNFAIVSGKMYALVFKHSATLGQNGGNIIGLTMVVRQGAKILNTFSTSINPEEQKNEVIYFETKNNDEVVIDFICEGNNSTITLEDIIIYQCKVQQSHVCIDRITSSNYSKTINGINWNELDENYKNVYYGTSQTSLAGKMYFEDLVENQKNLNSEDMNQYFWFDKKRGLIVTPQVSIEVGYNRYNLSDIKIGVISESDKITTLNYNDYADVDSFNTEYIVYKSNDSEYTTKTKYNNNFLVNQTEDYNGIVTTYSYDSYSHLLQEEVLNGKDNLKMSKTYTYTNNYLTQETMMVNGTNKSILYEYDLDNGNLLKTTYPNGQVVENKFDSTSRKLVEVSSEISTDNINLNKIGYEDDLVISLKSTEKGYEFTYGKYNEVEKVHQGDLLIGEINTLFDNFEVVKTYDLKRTPNTYLKYHYDKFGNLFLTEKSTDNVTFTPSKTLFYSDKEVDLIDDITLPNAQAMNKSSNSKLRKVIDNEVSNTQKFYYDSEGKLNKVTNSLDTYYPTTTTYAYDDNDRVTGVEQTFSNDTFSTDIVYKDSLSDEVAKIKGTLDYSCLSVSDSIMSSFTGSLSCEVTNEYDSFGRIANKQYKYSEEEQQLANCKVYYSYQQSNNITNNLISSEYHSAFTSGTFNYTYDSMGQITSVNDGYYTTTYEYDTLGRLKRENNQKLNKTYLYSYDNNGNITYKGEANYTTSAPAAYKHDYFTYSTTTPDLMIKHNNQTISNLNGLPTFDGVRNYTWINGGQLSKLSYSATKYLDFKYDTDGYRIEKKYTSNGETVTHTYKLDGNKIINESVSTGSKIYELYYMYVGNELVGFIYDGDKYYYQKNFRNDIIGLYNSNGSLAAKYEYDAWGNHKVYSATGVETTSSTFIGNINPFRYRGYYYDVETGYFWLSSRYYSPELGRFIQPADVSSLNPSNINGLNLYVYANNNPIGKAKLSSITNVRTLSDFGTTMMIPTSKIPIVNSNVGNSNYWDPHVKGKWFDTDVPEFFNFTHDKIEFVNWSFSVYKGGLYFDHNENHSLYIAGGNISTYLGIGSEGVGLDLGANVLEIGYDGRIIDANVEFLTAGLTFMYKDGTFEFGIGAGWVGYSVTIDIDEIIKIIFGG